MNFLNFCLNKSKDYKRLLAACSGAVTATDLSRAGKANVISALPDDLGRRAVVIVADEGEAARLSEDLAAFGKNSMIFPARDLNFRPVDSSSRDFEQARIGVLSRLLQDDESVVIAPVEAALTYTIPYAQLSSLLTVLRVADTIDTGDLTRLLTSAGYTKSSVVEGTGQFAVRGGIIDIFVPGSGNPYRVELWGDEIDTIAEFDVSTQRRENTVNEITLCPAREVLIKDKDAFLKKLKTSANSQKNQTAAEKIERDIEKLSSDIPLTNLDKYMNLCFDAKETIFDYFDNAIHFVYEPARVASRIRAFNEILEKDVKNSLLTGEILEKNCDFFLKNADFCRILERKTTVFLETFAGKNEFMQEPVVINFNLGTLSPHKGLTEDLAKELESRLKTGYSCAVFAGSARACAVLAKELAGQGLPAAFLQDPLQSPTPKTVIITKGILPAGIDYIDQKIAVFTLSHSTAAPTKRRRYYKGGGGSVGSLEELKVGEPVVHAVYGIGIFCGIKKVETEGIAKDYITLKFQKDDMLYVPVTSLDMVSRYIGAADAEKVKLNKLGTDSWAKAKSRVKAAVKDMAKELIALYSKRMQLKGFAFDSDNELQQNFEEYFPFCETEDQLRSTTEIKADMQRSVPMERLLCGDVGFGKTEVALRAAFKAVLSGKQAAILVPTTILAWQHYKTLTARMEHFAVNLEMLSRFRTARQQTAIKKDLAGGKIDIIVGTHRIISGDVKFRDLGLLIIDEEQRFGVAQKEKLKAKFPTVDVLTLSATPIPRTLNMAMSGIRDMSIIEEAPQDRRPVQTYVMEYDRSVVLRSIQKELARGGQVYYVYNRVESINAVAARLQSDLPDARIAVAHGQMSEEELSEKWRDMIDCNTDVLVCTTIIESGVDIPNVNTMIVENADRFGLSQLHQLRGRVGRSSRKAYAYMMYRRGKALSEIATKRLEAIREFTEFGSGFKIAMRDLEIRGAGNVLGASQHGHLDAVGYDMYVRLLSRAIKEEKGEVTQEPPECLIDLQVPAHIPQSYIENTSQRLQIYRRIAEVKNRSDSDDVIDELIDRFGEPPSAVLWLIEIAILRSRAAALNITEINDKRGNMVLFFKEFDIERLKPLMQNLKGRVMISAGEKPHVAIRAEDGQDKLALLKEVLAAF